MTQRKRHRRIGHPAGRHIEPGTQMRIVPQRLLPALAGQGHGMADGGVVECKGRGAGHRPGHVRHAVVHHAVDDEGRLGMGGRMRGLEAAALVDRHIDDDGARLHLRHHGTRHQLGRRGPRDQHAADHQIGPQHRLLHAVHIRVDRADAVAEDQVELAQAVHILVQHRDPRAQAHGHLQRMGADHAAAQYHHLGRGNTWHPTQQHAHATLALLQMRGTGLDGHAAGHLAHRRQQGQAAAGAGDGFVGDAQGARLHQRRGLLGVGREMQIGVEDLALAQQGAFLRLRLLDLDDHVGLGEDAGRIGHELRAGGEILLVAESDGGAGAALHQHPVAARAELAHTGRRQADTVLMVLDLPGAADHGGMGHRKSPVGLSWRLCTTARPGWKAAFAPLQPH
eukprot:Opistho-2@48068